MLLRKASFLLTKAFVVVVVVVVMSLMIVVSEREEDTRRIDGIDCMMIHIDRLYCILI